MARDTTQTSVDPALKRFAAKLSEQIGASRVLLFGSHAHGLSSPDSDYDLIIVSDSFTGLDPMKRSVGLRSLWYEAGGDSPLDLICLTEQEFSNARRGITLIAAVTPDAVDILPLEAR